jgi:hypothetical protein
VLLAGVLAGVPDDLSQKSRNAQALFLRARGDGGQCSDFFRGRVARQFPDLVEHALQLSRGLDVAPRSRSRNAELRVAPGFAPSVELS